MTNNSQSNAYEGNILSKLTVSVVVPSYNMGWCISQAIKSCQNQSYSPEEIIIVDDGSADDTRKVVQNMAIEDSRIKYIGLSFNRGSVRARIEGILASKGEWIAFLDADDEFTQKSIEYRVETLERNKDLNPGLVYGHVYMEEESEETLFRNPVLNGYVYPFLCRELSLCQQIVMMIRRECFETAGFPDLRFPSCMDDDMIMTIAKHFTVVCADKPVAIIHLHKSESRITNDYFRVINGIKMLVNKYKDDIVKYHGYFYLGLWQLRIVADYMRAEGMMGAPYYLVEASKNMSNPLSKNLLYVLGYISKHVLFIGFKVLRGFLKRYFEYLYL